MVILVNLLTASRMVGVIPFLWMVWGGHNSLALLFFVGLSLTDAADGYLARKFGAVTRWGKFFDPTADKVLLMTAIWAFMGTTSLFGLLVLGFYESLLFLTALLAYLFPKKIGQALGANWAGKAKVWAEIALVFGLFADNAGLISDGGAVEILFSVSIILALMSLLGHWRPLLR